MQTWGLSGPVAFGEAIRRETVADQIQNPRQGERARRRRLPHHGLGGGAPSKRRCAGEGFNPGLRRLGYSSDEMTAPGFRAMASTLLNESGKWHPDAIERALAHSDKVSAAYQRGAHWKERVETAHWWSDYLDRLRSGRIH